MNKRPLVSVIIPVYNCEQYVAQAIESVLKQNYRPIEIIVVDDGSTDGSAGVARRFNPYVRYHFQSNSGAGAARNRGIELATGSYLAFLDADDIWSEEKLTLQMAVFKNKSQFDMVFGHVRQFFSPELEDELKKRLALPVEISSGHHVGTMLIKRDSFFRVGMFATDLKIGEFVDWHAKATDLGLRSILLPEVLMKRRIHANNTVVHGRQHQADYVRILKSALDRRREV